MRKTAIKVSQNLSRLDGIIRAHGFAVVQAKTEPDFSYTCGLSRSVFGAELMMLGDVHECNTILHQAATIAMEGGWAPRSGGYCPHSVSGHRLQLRMLPPHVINDYLRMATLLHGEPLLHAYQLAPSAMTPFFDPDALVRPPLAHEDNI